MFDVDGSCHDFGSSIMCKSLPLSRHAVSGNQCASNKALVVRSQPDAGDDVVFSIDNGIDDDGKQFLSDPSTSTSVSVSNFHAIISPNLCELHRYARFIC